MKLLRLAELAFYVASSVLWLWLAIRQSALGLPVAGLWFALVMAAASVTLLVMTLLPTRKS